MLPRIKQILTNKDVRCTASKRGMRQQHWPTRRESSILKYISSVHVKVFISKNYAGNAMCYLLREWKLKKIKTHFMHLSLQYNNIFYEVLYCRATTPLLVKGLMMRTTQLRKQFFLRCTIKVKLKYYRSL